MTSDLIKENAELRKHNAELTCQMKRNIYCYSCLNTAEKCYRKEIGCPCGKYKSYKDENAELKAKIEKMADCSNCKHWHYSTRLLAYFCDCSDKISDSINSRTYEHCDKWELAE